MSHGSYFCSIGNAEEFPIEQKALRGMHTLQCRKTTVRNYKNCTNELYGICINRRKKYVE